MGIKEHKKQKKKEQRNTLILDIGTIKVEVDIGHYFKFRTPPIFK